MKYLKAQLCIALVCIILGLMLAYQFQNAKNIASFYKNSQVDELQGKLEDMQKQKDSLEKEVASLEGKVEQYEKNAGTANGMAKQMKDELDNIRTVAGLTNVEGPGVDIKLSPINSNLNSENSIPASINSSDISAVINELNACGAEAISINGQRIIGASFIRDVGSNISINGQKWSGLQDFEIKAIGDPTALETGLNIAAGVKEGLETAGINVKIQKSNKIKILKYNGIIEMKYAINAKEGE
ncbi:MAG: DUF881 domain-containing protein [Clostridiales bacterium]|nr:DUF881 domain-containing protein [Clostridiales bacterium]HBM81823.1 hypothetical protein [Clostridiaceae bacterium]